jgi:hypothetical protein
MEATLVYFHCSSRVVGKPVFAKRAMAARRRDRSQEASEAAAPFANRAKLVP